MNSLALAVTPDNGLTFELIVDDKPISHWLADGNEGIPYWIVNEGLPTWPPHTAPQAQTQRIVSVCGCGEYGCGHSRCTVRTEGETVVFEDFAGDVASTGRKARFVFPREQYETVCRTINEQRSSYRDDA
jgi:hypothetical protein